MALRYCLIKQLHFFADVDGRNTVVTIQHWQTRDTKHAVYVRCHDGREVARRFTAAPAEHAMIERSFEIARADFAGQMLSEDAAGDEVARRGGPKPAWCTTNSDCSAMIPFAAAQCAEGHASTHVDAGTYVFGSRRRPALISVTGGKL